MSFYAHIAPNLISSSAALGYNMLPFATVTGVLDTIYADLSSSVASGTNNGWVVWDDLRSWNTGTLLTDQTGLALPIVPITVAGLWNSTNPGSANGWFVPSASLTWVAYVPWGRDFTYSISMTSSSPTDVSFDSGTTWYKAYFTAKVANYSTATLDRPFSASAAGNTYVHGVYQRNFKYLVLKQNSSTQKKFCVLLAAAQDRPGGASLYMRVYEDWDATNHSGTGLPSSWEYHRPYIFPNGGYDRKLRLMTWFLPEAFAIWTSGIGEVVTGEKAQLTYIGNLEPPLGRTDPDALAFIPGSTEYSGYGIHGQAVQGTIGEGMGFQCLRTVGGRPWTTPTYGTGTFIDNGYQLWPRTRNINFAPTNYQRDYQGRFLYTEFDVWHCGQATPGYYVGAINEGRRGKLRYAKTPVGNPNGMQFSTMSGTDGHRYIFVRQSAPTYGALQSNTQAWGNSDASNNGNAHQLLTGWAFDVQGNGTANYSWGDVWPYTNPIGGFYNYVMLPVDM